VVWVNATNLFDAAAGFGGYRESGYGREGGREGMWEYVKRMNAEGGRMKVNGTARAASRITPRIAGQASSLQPSASIPAVDRTPKLFIGGKQARPDSGYSRAIVNAKGQRIGEVGDGNRKDLRNAVEAAHAAAKSWSKSTAHLRAQILFYIGENLSARADEFVARLRAQTGATAAHARAEVEASVSRLFSYAAWADKWDGAVHNVPIRGVALQMNEPIGVVAVAAPDEAPLLGFVSTVAPLLAAGNAVVVVPSETHPLSATDLYTVLESSDVPAGAVNIVTGVKDVLAKSLAEHDDVESIWYWGSKDGKKAVELASAGNMKRTWCHAGVTDWAAPVDERAFLREATQVKNIWVPYGE
jgi:aldehyde dehydrogenase (NAD+)